ncbi:hypothetical protein Tco_0139482 [Tanacetum coccineum]
MVKLSTSFILKLSGLYGLMGGSGPLSSPRLTFKDRQFVFKPKSSSGVSSKGSTAIGIPKVSSTSSGNNVWWVVLFFLALGKIFYGFPCFFTTNSLRFPSAAKSRSIRWKNPTSTIPDQTIANLKTQLVENEVVRVKIPKCMVYTPPVTHSEEVKETTGIPMEVEPLNEKKLEEVGLNCNHNTPFSSREDPSFDKPGPQPQPSPNCPPLDASLGTERGFKPPIKPQSPDSFRMKVIFDEKKLVDS